jgi:hypothetical protein
VASVIGQLRVTLGLDSGQFQRGVGTAGRSLQQLRSGLIAVSAAMAAVGAAAFALVSSTASAANEIRRQSQIANTSADQFQRMAFAARSVGIEQDKLADILKDVNDRVGDFLQTGGGPMADFFENIAPQVGVTADMFRDLSGADALQLYVDTLERAGVSQQDMTFYLEAMASDATALIPLLANGGTELERLGNVAADSGAIMSDSLIAKSGDFREAMDGLRAGVQSVRNEIAERLMPTFTEMINAITTNVIPVVLDIVEKVGEWMDAFRELPEPIQEAVGAIALALGVGGPLILAVGAVSTAFAALVAASGPIGLFIAAAALLTSAWVMWGDDIKAAIGPAVEWITEKFQAVVDTIQSIIDKAIGAKNALIEMFEVETEAGERNAEFWRERGRETFSDPTMIPGVSGGLADGLIQGLEDSMIVERSADVFGDVTDAARDEWEIRSPSRVFQEFGRMISEGLGLGIREGEPEVASAMSEVVETTTDAVTATSDALQRLGSSANRAFLGLVTGAMSWDQALRTVQSSLSNIFMQIAESSFSAAFNPVFGAVGSALTGAIGQNAQGTNNWRGGLTWVGEEGPEIVNLPRGSQVFDADTSASMAQGGGGQVAVVVRMEGGNLVPVIESVSGDVAARVVAGYDRQLEGRVAQINRDPRRR